MQQEAGFSAALRRRFPVETFILLARDGAGKDNPITVNWVMRTSGDPPLLAVAIAYPRYSYEVVRQAGAFVIAAPSMAMEEETRFFGTVSGRDHDKLAERESATEPAGQVETVLLSEAVLNIECVLESEFETGDHAVFVGRVVAGHVNADSSVERLYTVGPGHRFGSL